MKGEVARRPNDDGISPALGAETRAPHSGDKPLERDDPFELIGTGYPVTDGEKTDRETARCIIEEYALSGFTASEIFALFESPQYGFPNAILQRRGTDFVRRLVGEVFGGTG